MHDARVSYPIGVKAGLAVSALWLAVAAFAPIAVHAQDDEDEALQRWVIKGELTSVLAQGNAETLTLGFGGQVRRRWEKHAVRFEAGSVRAQATRITRRAVGEPDAFALEVDRDTEVTTEVYFARGRYDLTLSDEFFGFGGIDWLRNTPTGIESRFLIAAGAGNTWADNADLRFSTSYAGTYTFQSDVVANPFVKTDFAGLRAGWELFVRVSESTQFDSEMISDLNLESTEDVRVDLTNALTVNINESLALKPSLQLLLRSRPSLVDVPLFSPLDVATNQSVAVPLKKADTFFRLALVLTL
jgi:hypothetical protein